MFASKTPSDLTSHAAAKLCTRCEAEFQEDGVYSEDEHRDYHQPAQHNEPNPILTNLRQRIATDFDCVEEFAWWIEHEYNHDTDSWVWEDESTTESHVAHARRVLTRLANLTEGN